MGDETENTMNLDLNLGPVDNLSDDDEDPILRASRSETITLEDLLLWERRHRRPESLNLEAMEGSADGRVRSRRQRRQRWRSVQRDPPPVPPETRNLALELTGASGSQSVPKMCDDNNGCSNEEDSRKRDENEKKSGDEISFFDCNICLDLAQDPVVTCCGHLFCWPCLYRWLHLHSDAKECPVCKGEVTMKTVTPIYGRGRTSSSSSSRNEGDSTPKIPNRPKARRFESWRQTIQRAAFTIPMEEMIRRLGNRFDLAEVPPPNPEDSPERRNSLLARILTSRGMRREQNPSPNPSPPPDETVDTAGHWDNGRLPSLLRQISDPNSNRSPTIPNLSSTFSSAERLVESYFRSSPFERSQEQLDDRDSVSSIAAMIHSESQTVDTTIEIDSTVSLTASSSGRRNDVDSGDSRPPRRRRLY